MKYCLLLLLIFFSIQNTMAAWGDKSSSAISSYPMEIDDAFVSTTWGVCAGGSFLSMKKDLLHSKVDIPVEHMASKKMPVVYYYHEDVKEVARELVVYIPGTFGNARAAASKKMTRILYKDGNDVLVLQNTWGSNFVKQFPQYTPGDFVMDAKVSYQAIVGFLKKAKKEDIKFSRIRLVGMSYGAFTAAIISKFDRESVAPQFADITLLSPPHHLGRSLELIDQYVDESAKYLKPVMIELRMAKKLIKICRTKEDKEVSEKKSRHSKAVFSIIGFHSNFVKTLRLLEKVSGRKDFVPKRKKGIWSKKYRKWKKNVRMATFLKDHFPKTYELMMGPQGNINYWIKTADKTHSNVRILTTQNDPINEKDVWVSDASTIVLPTGGHYGYRGLKSWYSDFLREAF